MSALSPKRRLTAPPAALYLPLLAQQHPSSPAPQPWGGTRTYLGWEIKAELNDGMGTLIIRTPRPAQRAPSPTGGIKRDFSVAVFSYISLESFHVFISRALKGCLYNSSLCAISAREGIFTVNNR